MREEWDQRAKEAPLHYVVSSLSRGEMNLARFYEDGYAEGLSIFEPLRALLGEKRAKETILEIGCGPGRLFQSYKAMGFSEIWGTDVSPEMLRHALEWCPVQDARLVLSDGSNFPGVESGYFDACVSYMVFQHLPNVETLIGNLSEAWRVLKPGGVFQFHFRQRRTYKQRLFAIIPRALQTMAERSYNLLSLRYLRGKPIQVVGSRETWQGLAIPIAATVELLEGLGFGGIRTFPDLSHPDGTRSWAVGWKPID